MWTWPSAKTVVKQGVGVSPWRSMFPFRDARVKEFQTVIV